MKRFISILLTLVLVISLMPSTLAVAESNAAPPKLIISTETAGVGEEVTLTVSTENNPGVGAMTLGLIYDSTKLAFVGYENGEDGFTGWKVKTSAVWIGSDDCDYNGVILKLKFRVLDTAADGLAAVSLRCEEGDAYNFNEDVIPFEVISGGINVKKEVVETPKLLVSTETAGVGEEVTLTVSTENNPGVGAMTLGLIYDSSKLAFVGFENGEDGFTGWKVKTSAVWIGSDDCDYNGVILKLKFKVLDTAADGLASVSLRCEEGDAYNFNEDVIPFEVISGGINVKAHTHNYTSVVTAPTCTEQGYTTYTCACGDSYKDNYVEALGHKTVIKNAKTATCTEQGYTGDKVCTVCNTLVEQGKAIAKLGHNFGNWTVTKAATCTEKGIETRCCSRCDATETREVNALGHSYIAVVTAPTCTEQGYTTYTCTCGDSYKDNYVDALGHKTVIKNAKTATCTEQGYTGDKVCTVCNTLVEQGKAIAKLGHNFGNWTVTKAATCTEKGIETRCCSRCDATETREVNALGHSCIAVVTAPTCTEKGYTTYTCSVCGDTYKDNYVNALGHRWDEGKITTEPTEYTDGVKTFTCDACKETKTEVIPALGHTHNFTAVVTAPTCTEQGYTTYTCTCGNSYVADYKDVLGHSLGEWVDVKLATCTEKGIETRSCSRCDATETREVNALGHDFGNWVVIKAATCTEKGVEKRFCSLCGTAETREVTVGAHSFGEWVVTKAATCTEKGVETHICSLCDAAETREIEVADHNYKDGACTVCGEIEPDFTPAVPVPTISIKTDSGKPTMSWAAVDGAVKYDVYRATSKTGTYSKYYTTTNTSYTNTSVVPGTTYYYKVKAVAANGNTSDFSAIKYITCDCAQPVTTLSVGASNGKPILKWSAVDGATKYEVWRATSKDGNYVKYFTTSNTSYTNLNAVAGHTYYYKVKAICGKSSYGNSAFSAMKYITCDCAAPVVSVSTVASSGKPILKWSAVDGATKYEIWCATSRDGEYIKYYTTTGTSCTDTLAVAGTTYYYKVKAICGKSSYGDSAFSAVKYITCDCAKPVVSITTSDGHPKLSWTAVDGADRYIVYRATGRNGTYYKYDTTSKTTYTNISATAGTTYYYKVVAVSDNSTYADSAYSSVVSIKAK